MAVLALAAVGGGVYALTSDDSQVPARLVQAVALPSCRPVSPAPSVKLTPLSLPTPAAVVFQLLNGTDRSGLGKTVGDELAARSLKTQTFGNAPAPITGDTVIAYGPGREPSAQVLAANILGVRLVATTTPAELTVTLGSNYTRLTTPQEVKAYVDALMARTAVAARATPILGPSPTATPRPDPSCT